MKFAAPERTRAGDDVSLPPAVPAAVVPETPRGPQDDDKEAEDKSDEKDDDGEVPMLDKEFDEGEEVELETPAEDKFTNDLDPTEK